MLARMNLKRGLFRLWLIGTVVWIAAAATIFHPDWPASTLWSLGPFGTINQTKLVAQLRPVDAEIRRLEASGVTRLDAAIADLSGKPVPASVADWEKLQAERDAITSHISSAKLRAESWSKVGHFSLLAFGPPLAVFLFGLLII